MNTTRCIFEGKEDRTEGPRTKSDSIFQLSEQLSNVDSMNLEITTSPFSFELKIDERITFGKYGQNDEVIEIKKGKYNVESFEKTINDSIKQKTSLGVSLRFLEVKNAIQIQSSKEDINIIFSINICRILRIPYDWFSKKVTGLPLTYTIRIMCNLVDNTWFNGERKNLVDIVEIPMFTSNKTIKTDLVKVSDREFNTMSLTFTDHKSGEDFPLLSYFDRAIFKFKFHKINVNN